MRPTARPFVALEPLEPRALLAADLTGAFATLVSASIPSGSTQSLVINVNNPTLEAAKGTARVDFFFSADDQKSDDDIPIGSGKLSGKIAPGATAPKTFKVTLPTNLVAGTGRIIALLDAGGTFAEADETNNTVVSEEITVTQPDYDLHATFGEVKFPTAVVSGVAVKGTAKVLLSNVGTAQLGKKQSVNVKVYLRPADALDDSTDVLVSPADAKAIVINNLKGGATKNVVVKIALGAGQPIGGYKLVTVIDDGNALAETDETNNTTIADVPAAITVAEAFVDLNMTAASTTFGGSTVGNTSGKGSVTLVNNGNVPAAGTVNIEFFATTNGTIDGNAILIGQANPTNVSLKPGASKAYAVNLAAPLVGDDTVYQIVARMTPVTGITDTNSANDTHTAGSVTVTEAPRFMTPLGDAITFTQTGFSDGSNQYGGTTVESGNWADNKGHTGQYSYTCISVFVIASPGNKIGSFILTSNDAAFATLNLICTFKGTRPAHADGRTMNLAQKSLGTGKVTVVFSGGPGDTREGTFQLV
ncbi:MAG: hypothetical protein K8S99_16020 [Planctomycetes bacterium]|nr:hypothetical protein [Planctomycetota bacterium]